MHFQLIIFALCVVEFHISEYLLAKKYQTKCTKASFLLSRPYVVAMTLGLVEFALRFQARNACLFGSGIGICMIICGEILRKIAMCTAKGNFSHKIAIEKSPDHRLCTHGIYYYIRHPSYLGFCLYAVGTQLWLGNSICAIIFTFLVWKFMSERVTIEDALLHEFFGKEWRLYQSKTWSGIPFIP